MFYFIPLKERIASLEEKLLRVSNIYRYETLQNLLKEAKWLEADKETVRLILEIAGQAEIENLRPEEIAHIDCSELQVIDRLWLTYSDNLFGFSIQSEIYQDLGGSVQTTIEQDAKLIEKWGDRLSIVALIARILLIAESLIRSGKHDVARM